jgi:hypothetical protein
MSSNNGDLVMKILIASVFAAVAGGAKIHGSCRNGSATRGGLRSPNRGSVIVHDVLQNLGVATQICALTRDCTHIL